MRRFTRKRVVAALSLIAVLAVAGGAYAYFTSTGNGTGSGTVGAATNWGVATTTSGGPLYPGVSATDQTAQLTITNNGSGKQELNAFTISVAGSGGYDLDVVNDQLPDREPVLGGRLRTRWPDKLGVLHGQRDRGRSRPGCHVHHDGQHAHARHGRAAGQLPKRYGPAVHQRELSQGRGRRTGGSRKAAARFALLSERLRELGHDSTSLFQHGKESHARRGPAWRAWHHGGVRPRHRRAEAADHVSPGVMDSVAQSQFPLHRFAAERHLHLLARRSSLA